MRGGFNESAARCCAAGFAGIPRFAPLRTGHPEAVVMLGELQVLRLTQAGSLWLTCWTRFSPTAFPSRNQLRFHLH
jgi:hypothetical protein